MKSFKLAQVAVTLATLSACVNPLSIGVTDGITIRALFPSPSPSASSSPGIASLSISDGPTFAYASTTVGASVSKTFTVVNSGSGDATSLSASAFAGSDFLFSGGAYPGAAGTCGSSLAASATCTVVVLFAPQSSGALSDTITLSYFDGSASQSATRAVSGSGLSRALLAIGTGTFSDTTVGATSSAVTFTVTNSGGSTATLSAAPVLTTGTQYTITGGTCVNGGTVAAAATCTVTITFNPTSSGVKADTVTVAYGDAGGALTAATRALSATALGRAALAISAETFPNTTVGNTSAAVTFTVTNSGGSTATLSAAPVLTTGTQYAIAGGTCVNGGTIAAAGTCTITITFTPTSSGVKADTLTVAYGDVSGALTAATQSLSATGLTKATITIAANTYTDTFVGSNRSVTFTATNGGETAATISSRTMTTGTQYAITGGTCTVASTVAASGTCTIIVRFTPTSDGTKADTINLGYTDGVGSVSATRAISAVGHAQLAISFGGFTENPAGESTTEALATVSNPGAVTATITSLSMGSGHEISIVAGGTCAVSGTLASGGSCTVNVRFSAGILTINSSDLSYTAYFDDGFAVVSTKNSVSNTASQVFAGSGAPYNRGLGTSASPYEIDNVLQFRVIGDFPTAHFLQTNDLDFAGIDGSGTVVPENTLDQNAVRGEFQGVYHGGSKKIMNFAVDDTSTNRGGALFESVSGEVEIKDLTIENYSVISSADISGLIANTVSAVNVTISNIQISGPTLGTFILNKSTAVGGMFGQVTGEALSIENSSFSGAIDASIDSKSLGGLIGEANPKTLSLTTVSSSGTIACSRTYCGGLVGYLTSDGSIRSSSSTVILTETVGADVSIGGLVSVIDNSSAASEGVTIFQSYFSGEIYNEKGVSNYTGGLVGYHVGAQDVDSDGRCTGDGDYTLRIRKSWSSGKVMGSLNTGGIIGESTCGVLDRVYSRAEVVGGPTGNVGGFVSLFITGLTNDSYFAGSVEGAAGQKIGGFYASEDHSETYRSISAATSVVDTDDVKMGSISGGGSAYYEDVYDFRNGDVPTVRYDNQGLAGTTTIKTPHHLDSASYVHLDFDSGADLWAMPSVNPNYGALTPVLRWQCGTDGITCL